MWAVALNKRKLMLGGLALLIIGAIMVYAGWSFPYDIKDMNGDGKVDWHDYDVNNDGKVDMLDIVLVARAYGSFAGDDRYNARLDFNQDGLIDDYDLNAIKVYFGEGLSLIGLIGFRLTGERGPVLLFGLALGFIGLACIIIGAVQKR